MRRLTVILLAAAAAALTAALIAHAAGSGPVLAFRTPDAGAACKLSGPSLVCSSLGSPASVALRGKGGAQVVSTLPWWDASTPVLHKAWHRGAISCHLTGNALLCRNGSTAIRVTAGGFAVAG
jgi:hypothetical protein